MSKKLLTAFLILGLIPGLFGQDDLSFVQLREKAMHDLQAKTSAHAATWGLGDSERWDLDQTTGELVFTFKDKVVTCKAQIIGTWNKNSETWLWAWANKSVDKALTKQSEKIRAYGVEKKIEQLTNRGGPSTEDEAWQLAALSCVIGDAQGVYRGPAGATYVFIAFGEPSIRKK